MIKRYVRECKEYSNENYLTGIILYEIVSTLITTFGIPFAYVDLFAAYIYPFPFNIFLMFLSKTLGSSLCFFITRMMLSEEKRKSFMGSSIIQGVNEVITTRPIFYGTLIRYASLPTSVKNFGLSAMNISFGHYVICCFLGSILFVPL